MQGERIGERRSLCHGEEPQSADPQWNGGSFLFTFCSYLYYMVIKIIRRGRHSLRSCLLEPYIHEEVNLSRDLNLDDIYKNPCQECDHHANESVKNGFFPLFFVVGEAAGHVPKAS